jgi:hypothetical protein
MQEIPDVLGQLLLNLGCREDEIDVAGGCISGRILFAEFVWRFFMSPVQKRN